MANKRHKTKPEAHKLTAGIVDVIENYIRQDWSPEQVVGWLEREGIITLHHETLYQRILSDKRSGGDLYTLFVIRIRPTESVTGQHIRVIAAAYLTEQILMNDLRLLMHVSE